MIRNSNIQVSDLKILTLGSLRMAHPKEQKEQSMLIHPKYRLIYRFTSTTLYVVAFRATMMKG